MICSDCHTSFNPMCDGIVGKTLSYCSECCNKPQCLACERIVNHVDAVTDFCDDCLMASEHDFAEAIDNRV